MNNHEEEKKEESIHDDMQQQQQQQFSVGQEWEPMPLVDVGPLSSSSMISTTATAVSNSTPVSSSSSSSSSTLTVWKRMHEKDPVRQQVVVKIAQLLLWGCLLQSENSSHAIIQSTNVKQQQHELQQQHVLLILPHVSKLYERVLFMDASTLHEYRNEQTLIQRLLNVKQSCLTTTSTTITTVPNINFSLPRLLNWMMDSLGKKYGVTKQQQQQQQALQPIPDNSKQPSEPVVQESHSHKPEEQTTSPATLPVLPHQPKQQGTWQPTSPDQQQPSSQQSQEPLLGGSALLLPQQMSTLSVETNSRKRPPLQQQSTVNPAQQSNQPPPKQKKPRVKPPPPAGPKPTQNMSFENKKQPPPPPPSTPPSPGAAASAVVATTDATLKHHQSPTVEPLQQEAEEDQQIQQLFLSQCSRQKLTRALFNTLVKESPPSDDPQWNQELYEWAKGVEDECYQSAKSHTEYTKSIQKYLRLYRIQCLVSKPDSIGTDFENLPDDRKEMVNIIIDQLAEESLPSRSSPLNVEDCMAKAMAIEERLHASSAEESKEQTMDAATLKQRIEQIAVELANSSNEEVAIRRILSSQDENDSLSSLADCRKQMIREIIHLILHAAEPSIPIKDILKKATFLEERLYNSSASKKEYSDLTTLKDRLERLGAGLPAATAAAAAKSLECDQSNILYSILNQDADLAALPQPRKKMIYEIIRLLAKTEKAPSSYSDYQDMVERVKFFELRLVEYAQSKQEYADADTLPDRLKSLKTMFAASNSTHSTAAAAAVATASQSVNVANPAVDDTKLGIGPSDREMMVDKLNEIFLQADGGAETPKQKRAILAKARYFEKRLYVAAKSKEEYFSMDTLKDRLERNAIEIAQATIAKRSSASESSTKVTNLPWQESSTSSTSMATNRRLKDAPSSVRKSSTSNAIKAANANVHVIDLTLEDSPPNDRHSSGNELTKPTTTTTSMTTTTIAPRPVCQQLEELLL